MSDTLTKKSIYWMVSNGNGKKKEKNQKNNMVSKLFFENAELLTIFPF